MTVFHIKAFGYFASCSQPTGQPENILWMSRPSDASHFSSIDEAKAFIGQFRFSSPDAIEIYEGYAWRPLTDAAA
jgi:hypothetical protein